MIKKLLLFILLFPTISQAHPGVGIVKDRKGNIYYTDLQQVWKITNGNKSVLIPNVHTHELYMDPNDNLYGEGGYYDDNSKKFYHYLWVYRANGRLDTVIGMKEQYIHQDFSLSRDKKGNEYYIKRFLAPHNDTNHIYRKSPDGKEIIFATGNFKNVNWLHPQDDGSLLYVSDNAIYRVDSIGNITLVKAHIGNTKPADKTFWKNILIWGVWEDNSRNIYAAVLSDRSIKKIDTDGNITTIYTSTGNWSPLYGVFDNENRLWVLESSDKNETRVTLAETNAAVKEKNKSSMLIYVIGVLVLGIFILIFRSIRGAKKREDSI